MDGGASRRPVVLVLALVGAAGSAVAVAHARPALVWLATGVLAASLAISRDAIASILAGRTLRLGRHTLAAEPLAAELACTALLVALTCLVLPGVILGDRPVAKDHTYHFVKALETVRLLLEHGAVRGWSPRFFAGYPHGVLYPPGGDLLVAAIHLGSLRLIAPGAAYALAVWLTVFLGGYAAYRLGAAALDRRVGLVAGVAVLLDGGGFDQGGFTFVMGWGVWPQSLAVALSVLAVSRVPALLREGRRRDVLLVAALTAAAIVSHPLQLPFTGLVIGAVFLAWVLAPGDDGAARSLRGPGRVALASGAGVLLAGFWLGPFATSGAEAIAYGKSWLPSAEIAEGLLGGTALVGLPPLVLAAGLIGVAALLLSRERSGLLVALLALLPLVLAAGDVLAELRLLAPGAPLSRVQLERFTMLARPFLLVAAAFAIFAALDRARAPQAAPLPRYARTFVVVVLAAPLLVPAVAAIARGRVPGAPLLESSRPYAKELAQVRAFAATLPLRRGERWANEYRWPAAGPGRDEAFDALAPLDVPVFRGGYIPASTYRLDVAGSSAELYRVIDVRYVLSNEPKGPGFRELARFGPFVISEVEGPLDGPFQVIEGGGDVHLVSLDDEAIVLEAAPGASGKLRLAVSWFPRWGATRDGEDVVIEAAPLDGVPGTGFMVVPLAPGTYRFTFRAGLADWLGRLATLAGIGLLALVLLRMKVPWPARWPQLVGDRLPSRVQLAFASALLLVGALAGLAAPRSRVAVDLVRELGAAEVSRGGEPCRHEPDGVWCGEERVLTADAAPLVRGEVVPCVSVKLDGRPVILRWPEATVRRVRGVLGPRRGAARVAVTVRAGGRELTRAEGRWGQTFDARSPEVKGAIEVVLEGSGNACVEVRVLR